MPSIRTKLNKGKGREDSLYATNVSANHTSGPRQHRCEFETCLQIFSTSASLKRHQTTHNDPNDRPYPCNKIGCVFSANQKQGLLVHLNSVHKHLRRHCDLCPRHYADPSGLSHHRRRAHAMQRSVPRKQNKTPRRSPKVSEQPLQTTFFIGHTNTPQEEQVLLSLSPSPSTNAPAYGYEGLASCGPSSSIHIWQPRPISLPRRSTDLTSGSYSISHRDLDANMHSGSFYTDARPLFHGASQSPSLTVVFDTTSKHHTTKSSDAQEPQNPIVGPSFFDLGLPQEFGAHSGIEHSASTQAQMAIPDRSFVLGTSLSVEEEHSVVHHQYNPISPYTPEPNLSDLLQSPSAQHQLPALGDTALMSTILQDFSNYVYNCNTFYLD